MAGVKEKAMKYKVVRAVRMLISLLDDDPVAESGFSIARSRFGFFWKLFKRRGERLFFRSYESALKFACSLAIRDTPIKEEECKRIS